MQKELQDELNALRNMSDSDIDFTDMPVTTDEQWARAERGKFYRPKMVAEFQGKLETKESEKVTEIDKDVKAWFAEHGVSINQVLRQYILHHQS